MAGTKITRFVPVSHMPKKNFGLGSASLESKAKAINHLNLNERHFRFYKQSIQGIKGIAFKETYRKTLSERTRSTFSKD